MAIPCKRQATPQRARQYSQNVQVIVSRLLTAALFLASAPAPAEIHKCRQGERVIYQEQPCPGGSQSLAPPETPPPPSAFEVEQARERARNEIAEAEALRKRDDKTARNQERAETRKAECGRLLDKIEKAKAGLSKHRALKSEQRRYRKECGPL